jgi:trigger factor
MKEQMFVEKENKQKEKKRLTLAEVVINKSKVEVPNLFIEGELDQMMASFADRVKRAGMEMNVYLKQAKKNIEDLRKEWRTDAEKRAKLQLVFNEIAKKEMITPDTEKLLREVEHIKEHYPDADKESVAIYVTAQMTNEKVFEFLEGKEIKNEEETFKEDQKKKGENVHVHGEDCDHKH